MNKNQKSESRRGLLVSFLSLALLASFVVVPTQFRSTASSQRSEINSGRTESHQPGFEDYDIRLDKSAAADATLDVYRAQAGKSDSTVEAVRGDFVKGEQELRERVPTLKVEYNEETKSPSVIGPDVRRERAFLTGPSQTKRSEILREFIKTNDDLVGLTDAQIDTLKVTADYTNPSGNMSFAVLEQFVNNIPVFRAEAKAGFSKAGEMVRVINNLAAGLDYNSLSTDFGSPETAVREAFKHVTRAMKAEDSQLNAARSDNFKVTFGDGYYPTTAEKMYFPTDLGVARAAWRVLVWEDVAAFYVVIDAETGKLLIRENITKDQTQAATYNVYANTTSLVKSMGNPAPLSPGPTDPTAGTQGVIANRTNVTLIGNEAPYTFNNKGWIDDGNNATEGNNTLAGLDRFNPNGVDAAIQGSSNRVFNYSYNPAPGSPAPGDAPTPAGQAINPCSATAPATISDYQKGAVVQMFYVVNRYHDETYRLGFTEQARNFQNDNFGRNPGGASANAIAGNDRVLSEGQDCLGTNNANFSTPTDGTSGRMQMYVWTAPTPDRDGTIDAEIIIHELTHGLFGRLHNGVGGTQAGQMNEGNSDFFGHAMLSEATDPINGIYTTGGYSTLGLRAASPNGNYYYGIRRFPKAVMAFTGGPNNRPHNPLTFADIDPAQINVADGAYPAVFNGSATAVHDGGEIWSSALWEVRAKLVARLGHGAGTRKVLQLVMDGMKLSPSNPTMLRERDAILAAAQAGSSASEAAADVADVWAGFAIRGMGFGALNVSSNTVVQSFNLPSAAFDFDGDAKADIGVFRASTGNWFVNRSQAGFLGAQFGVSGDLMTPSDFDGDGKADIGVFRPSAGAWYRLNSINNTFVATQFGQNGDLPRPGDYDGDGKADISVFRPAGGNWFRLNSNGGALVATQFGQNGDLPLVADFDGDNKDDISVFRASTGSWFRLNSNAGAFVSTQFGQNGDVPTPADFDGDGKDDIAVFRGSNGSWYRLNSNGGAFVATQFGQNGDVPTAADYDGDGKADISVFRPAGGNWFRLNSNGGAFTAVQFGVSGDIAVPSAYIQ